MRLVLLDSQATDRWPPAAVAVAAAAVVVVVAVAAAAAAAATAEVVPLVDPVELAAEVHHSHCWRCSVAFSGAFAAFSRPAAWILLGAVAPYGAGILHPAAVLLPAVQHCVVVGARLVAGGPLGVLAAVAAAAAVVVACTSAWAHGTSVSASSSASAPTSWWRRWRRSCPSIVPTSPPTTLLLLFQQLRKEWF